MATSKRVMKLAEKQVKNKKNSKNDKMIAEDVIKKGMKKKKKWTNT